MNKKILTSIIAMCIVAPTYANIGANESEPGCIESKIGATSGDTNMEAIWGANTINLVYTADGETFTPTNSTANTCTYDQHIVIPTNEPEKTGYTFTGWRVRVAAAPAQTTFDLSTLSSYINTNAIDYTSKNFAGNYCFYYNEDTEDEIESDTCTETEFSGLNNGEWKTTFSYGTVKGEARCSSQSGSNGYYTNGVWDNNGDWSNTTKLSTLTDETGEEGARYCWCKPTGYAEPNSSTYQPVASASWVFSYDYALFAECASACARDCAIFVQNKSGFRGAMFGVSSN